MPPQQTPTPSGSPGQSPYDFFLNSQTPQKVRLASKLPLPQDPFLRRLVLVGGGGVLLIIFIAILAAAIFGGKSSPTGLLTIGQEQSELIHVSTTATTEATSQVAKNLAVNVELTLTTDQNQLVAYAKSRGQGLSTQQLAHSFSKTADQQLTNAQAASNFDTVYAQIAQADLTAYQASLNQVYASIHDTTGRKLVAGEYANAKTLLGEATTLVSSLQNQ